MDMDMDMFSTYGYIYINIYILNRDLLKPIVYRSSKNKNMYIYILDVGHILNIRYIYPIYIYVYKATIYIYIYKCYIYKERHIYINYHT